jgi:hypothetical protein
MAVHPIPFVAVTLARLRDAKRVFQLTDDQFSALWEALFPHPTTRCCVCKRVLDTPWFYPNGGALCRRCDETGLEYDDGGDE